MIPWYEELGGFPHSINALTHEDGADGLLCASQKINAKMLQESYPKGIYPWYSEDSPVLWWTPSERAVLSTDAFIIRKSLRKTIAKWQTSGAYSITVDHAFNQVLTACANRPKGTWMTPQLRQAYTDWYHLGKVHSIEVWHNSHLVGGFYGVGIGSMFFGESMFSLETDASKVALACFVQWLTDQGADLIDCQQDTDHLKSLGAQTIPRIEFEAAISLRTQLKDLSWLQSKQFDLLAMYIQKFK